MPAPGTAPDEIKGAVDLHLQEGARGPNVAAINFTVLLEIGELAIEMS